MNTYNNKKELRGLGNLVTSRIVHSWYLLQSVNL
jgi:hypothetical protein